MLMAGRLLLFATVFAAIGVPYPSSAQSTQSTLTLLHTNDLHGHIHPWKGWEGELGGKTLGGMDRLAAAVKKVRDEVGKDKVLLLDAGDALADTAAANETQGAAVIDLMNAVGYDAMAIGNHEFDYGVEELKKRMSEAAFPILGANVVDRSGKPFAKPYVIKSVNGVKVGVLGLAFPLTPLTTEANLAGLGFRDAAATARHFIPKMRAAGAQLVIVLSHLGLSADRKLAKSVSGIDLIVGGHSHNRMSLAITEGKTTIAQAGAFGSDLGRLDVKLDREGIAEYSRTLILIDNDTLPPDPGVGDVIRAKYPPRESPTLAETSRPIPRDQAILTQEAEPRDRQSAADSLFADLVRQSTGSEITMLPGVSYGVALSGPAITENQLRNMLPHNRRIVTLSLTGLQIKEILEQSAENVFSDDPRQRVGGMIQASGLAFSYDPTQTRGRRIKEVRVGGVALDPARRYSVATNSLLAGGGFNYRALAAGKDVREGASEFDVVKEGLKRARKVEAPTDVRISRFGALRQ